MKRLICTLLSLTMIFSFSACQKKPQDDPLFTCSYLNENEEEAKSSEGAWLERKTKNPSLQGSSKDFRLEEQAVTLQGYPSINEVLLAFQAGRVKGMYVSLPVAQYLCAGKSDLKIVADQWSSLYQMAALPKHKLLLEQIDQKLGEWLSDGTMAALVKTYIGRTAHAEANIPTIAFPIFAGESTIKVAVTGSHPPFDYISPEGAPMGFSAAVLAALGEALDVNFELVVVDPDARMVALASGKADLLFWTLSTNEARISTDALLLTRPFFTAPNAYVTTAAYYELAKRIASLA